MRARTLAGLLAFGMAIGTAGAAARDSEPRSDLLHSDLPLFGDEHANKWPRSFIDTDPGSLGFGCQSRVRFGDWRYSVADQQDDTGSWYRFTNYGAMHCWAEVGEANQRAQLDAASSRPSFFVLLDGNGPLEVWALQIGARPGSDYLLLSRPKATGIVSTFTVLQRACRPGQTRAGASLDILITHYCSVRTSAELRRLALRMSRLPPLGTLTLVDTGR